MKKLIMALAGLCTLFSCIKNNDLEYDLIECEVLEFKVEGQVSSFISKTNRTVTVTMPANTDFTQLTVAQFAITPKAVSSLDIKPGTVLDLSQPLSFTLHVRESYEWTLIAKADAPKPATGTQLYNMSFDDWSMDGKTWNCFADDATDEQKTIWGTANSSLTQFGKDNGTVPVDDFVAVSGEGKRAVKMTTRLLDFFILKKLAAGSIFTGRLGDISFTTLNADLHWGVPFTDRPVSLEGYASYKPATINKAEDPYKDRMGQMDTGHIMVLLTDWAEPFKVNAPATLVDIDNDPAIIGYGKVVFDKATEKYEPFSLKIDYRSERTPKYVVIVASSSALGDYFTGGDGSELCLDELSFKYE